MLFAETVGKKTQFTSPNYNYRAHIQVPPPPRLVSWSRVVGAPYLGAELPWNISSPEV